MRNYCLGINQKLPMMWFPSEFNRLIEKIQNARLYE